MKTFFKIILKYHLKILTKLTLLIHAPLIIAIAGSTNKTFVKDEIKKMLIDKGLSVKSNPKSFNTEIGLPLAILDLPSGFNSYRAWLNILFKSFLAIISKNFSKILVLELGVSDPGDMKYLLSIVKPKIAIITDITQRYREAFSNMDELMGEYEYLVKKIPAAGLVILNQDNSAIKKLKEKTKAEIIFFSAIEKSNKEAGECWVANSIIKTAIGQSFNLTKPDGHEKRQISRFGQHHIYSDLIANIISKKINNFIN